MTNEREVYDPVMVWFHHDPASRGEHLWTVLQHVRFTMLDYDYLMRISEEENLINEDEDCLDSLIEALELMGETGGRRLSKVSSYTWNARRPTQAIDEIFLKKDGRALGLRIMGGVDRPSHVFRWGTKPGIFILKASVADRRESIINVQDVRLFPVASLGSRVCVSAIAFWLYENASQGERAKPGVSSLSGEWQ